MRLGAGSQNGRKFAIERSIAETTDTHERLVSQSRTMDTYRGLCWRLSGQKVNALKGEVVKMIEYYEAYREALSYKKFKAHGDQNSGKDSE